MRYRSVNDAQLAARKLGRKIFVEVGVADGVLEVYPGGRVVFWDASLQNQTYRRKRKSLTPDEELRDLVPLK